MRIQPTNKTTLHFVLAALISIYSLTNAQFALAQPQEVEKIDTTTCQLLKNVEGDSGYGKKIEWKSYAKIAALTRAERLGASHVVWEKFYPVGAFNGVAVAKAYKCS